jgi:hypothetical protein
MLCGLCYSALVVATGGLVCVVAASNDERRRRVGQTPADTQVKHSPRLDIVH